MAIGGKVAVGGGDGDFFTAQAMMSFENDKGILNVDMLLIFIVGDNIAVLDDFFTVQAMMQPENKNDIQGICRHIGCRK